MPLCASTANALTQTLKNAGLNTVQLSGGNETLSAVSAYLTCPNLILWAQIGHGAAGGAIQLGSMAPMGYPDVNRIGSSIQGKFYIFNCCYVGGSNIFSTTMMNNGASFLCAGDNAFIYSGTCEPAWKNMCEAVAINNEEVITSFNKYLKLGDPSNPWGYRDDGNGPYTLFATATKTPQKLKNNDLFSVSVTFHTIGIHTGAKDLTVALYTASGKQVYVAEINSPTVNLNSDNLNGTKLSSGIYFLTGSSNVSTSRKTFVLNR